MNLEKPEADNTIRPCRGIKNINMQEPYRMAEVKKMQKLDHQSVGNRLSVPLLDPRKVGHVSGNISNRAAPISHKNGKRYFSLESLMVLICLTVSLLILPLVLPPLPPPPFMLLLLPIGILGLLMVLAFMPSEVRDLTHTYM